MSLLEIAALVAGLLLLMSLVAVATMAWIRRRSRALQHQLLAECRDREEKIIIGPQPGLYRGADQTFGRTKGNGVLCLTEQRLLFARLTGPRIVIPREALDSARLEPIFLRQTVVGKGVDQHLVIHTRDGNRIGFLIRRPERWVEAVKRVMMK